MNVKLLRKIQKHILEEPRRLDMDVVLVKDIDPASWRDAPPCGTVGCIAGWACALSGKRLGSLDKAQSNNRRMPLHSY
jgi:hypothetical protein